MNIIYRYFKFNAPLEINTRNWTEIQETGRKYKKLDDVEISMVSKSIN